MKSDIEISRGIKLKPIHSIAREFKLRSSSLHRYGDHIAKINLSALDTDRQKLSKLILVTAMSPTKAGNGKTVTTVSIALGMHHIGKSCMVALREPSMGPVFGMKGGAAGGGYAQVLPMEAINLHFTGDFHAIGSANNTIAALLDNYQYHNQYTEHKLKEIVWRRVLDVNDRSLRFINSGLGGRINGIPTETGFDITPASEIMATICMAENAIDLQNRINKIVLGYKPSGTPFTVKDLGIGGAINLLLSEALKPNLVQTTENTPAIVHCGPFANIAHGCNSVLATKMAMSLSPYVVTEAGFGADLGAEKFLNIKCRLSGIQPSATVLVVTLQAIKIHGGLEESNSKEENIEALQKGSLNLERHVENLHNFGQNIVIALNRFGHDTDRELAWIKSWCENKGLAFAEHSGFSRGGAGAATLAETIVDVIEKKPSSPIRFTYKNEAELQEKIEAVAMSVYKAGNVEFSAKAQQNLKKFAELGWNSLPVCIAKTQYSFSDNPNLKGAPVGHTIHIKDLVINAGAGFVVAIAGEIMRMPGLPKNPAAMGMQLNNGLIEGLS